MPTGLRKTRCRRVCEAKQLPILVIDEAQHLRNDVLEDLRLLCNFAMDSENRLCLLLVGLTELRRRLAMAVHESLSQRLIVRHHLNGLDRAELDHYLSSPSASSCATTSTDSTAPSSTTISPTACVSPAASSPCSNRAPSRHCSRAPADCLGSSTALPTTP